MKKKHDIDFYSKLSQKIREEMKNRCITHTEIAQLIGVSRQHLSCKMHGNCMITIKELKLIAEELIISVDELLEGL